MDEPGPSNVNKTSLSESDKKEDDPTLDVTSPLFDPLKAIYSNSLILPVPRAKAFDNMAALESTITRLGSVEVKLEKIKHTKKEEKSKEILEMNERRFLPHQQMVKGKGPKARTKRDLLQQMEIGQGCILEQLKLYMNEKRQIKIYIRRNDGIRGYVTGYIEAFDKHWNIVISNAYECWKRRKFKYTANKVYYGEPQDMRVRLEALNIKLPKVKIKSLDRKHVECRRKLSQLLIRGEQISHICYKENKM